MRLASLSAACLLLPLAACVADAPASPPRAEATTRAVGAAVRCIEPRRIVARRVVSEQALVFEAGGVTFRNDLPYACPGLGRTPELLAIQIEPNGDQLCSGDSFRAYDPVEAKAVGAQAFPRCRLGDFTPIDAR